jgi:hypothetical protein
VQSIEAAQTFIIGVPDEFPMWDGLASAAGAALRHIAMLVSAIRCRSFMVVSD